MENHRAGPARIFFSHGSPRIRLCRYAAMVDAAPGVRLAGTAANGRDGRVMPEPSRADVCLSGRHRSCATMAAVSTPK